MKCVILAAAAALLMAGCSSYQTTGCLRKPSADKVGTESGGMAFRVGDLEFESADDAWFTQTLNSRKRDLLHEIRAAGKKRSAADGKAALMDISVKTVSEDDEKGIPWPVMPLFGLVNRASLGILPFMPRQKATCLRVELQPESQPSTVFEIEMVNTRLLDVFGIWKDFDKWGDYRTDIAPEWKDPKGVVASRGHGFGGSNDKTVREVFLKLMGQGILKSVGGGVTNVSSAVASAQMPKTDTSASRMSVASSVEKEPRASRSAKSSVAPAQTPIVKPMPARPVAPPSPSTLEDLLKQGVVTQEEFDRLAK